MCSSICCVTVPVMQKKKKNIYIYNAEFTLHDFQSHRITADIMENSSPNTVINKDDLLTNILLLGHFYIHKSK